MAYQVLARKWRPKKFADLVGQEHVKKALLNSIQHSMLHHAYLLTGTRGVGKTTIARILAKSLNCQNQTNGEPCCQCTTCLEIDEGRYVDLLEIDAASNTGIDNIREVLDNAQYAPSVGQYKIYIIDEVHMLSKNAFNAMLKTLEEPPEHVKFILATTDPHKVPITILSRCLQFVLRNLTADQITQHLKFILENEKLVFKVEALQLVAKAAQGSMRDALSLLDQSIALGDGEVNQAVVHEMLGIIDKQYVYQILKSIHAMDSKSILEQLSQFKTLSVGFHSILDEFAVVLSDLALIRSLPDATQFQTLALDADLIELADLLNDEEIQIYYQCVIHGKKDLAYAPDDYTGFLMTMIRMLSFKPLSSKDISVHNVIENTQLSDLSPVENEVKKKPLVIEEKAIHSMIHSVDEKSSHLSTKYSDQMLSSSSHSSKMISSTVQTEEINTEQSYLEESPLHMKDSSPFKDELGQEKMIQNNQLNEANWHQVIEHLTPRLGPCSIIAQYLAFVKVENNFLFLSFSPDGEKVFSEKRLADFRKVIKDIFNLDVKLLGWEEEHKSVVMLNEQDQKEMVKQALIHLESDKIAQKLKVDFDSDWDINSLSLIK